MQESDTYLAILEEGEEKGQAKATREDILAFGEERLGMPDESIKDQSATLRTWPASSASDRAPARKR